MKQYIENMDDEVRCGHLVTAQTKRIWNIQLNLAARLLEVCNKHNLKIWCDGGTLLGTIRHRGFIPWDDDMDFAMMRKDFDILQKVAPEEFSDPFFFQDFHSDKYYFGSFAKLMNEDSCMLDIHDIEFPVSKHKGIFIDIFVLDDVPDSEEKRNEVFCHIDLCHNYMRHRTESQYLILPHRFLAFLKEGFKLGLKAFWSTDRLYRHMDGLLKSFGHSSSQISLLAYSSRSNLVRSKDCYQETIFLPFETITLPVMSGYDRILKKYYGDYMVPVKGAAQHDTTIISADISYKEYEKRLKFNYIKGFFHSVGLLLRQFGRSVSK